MQITQDHLDELEFPKLLSEIAPYAYSPKIAAEILETKPQQIDVAVSLLKKTSEFLSSYESENAIPFDEYEDIEEELRLMLIENFRLDAGAFIKIKRITEQVGKLQSFFPKFAEIFPHLSEEVRDLEFRKEIIDKISAVFNRFGEVKNEASPSLKEIREEISYIESTLLFIESSTDVSSLREIEEELIKLNYIKSLHNKKKTKLKKEVKYGLIEGEDYLILYGRNNLENDNLTFKVSAKDDYWFHVKDIPSSHIILKTSKLTDELIVKSAQVSAYFSKANLGEKVTVD